MPKELSKNQKENLILIEMLEDLLATNDITEEEFTNACNDINNF